MKNKKHKIKIPKGHELWSEHYEEAPDAIHITSVFVPKGESSFGSLPEVKREIFYEFEIGKGDKFKMNNQLFEFDSLTLIGGSGKYRVRAKKIESR